MFLPASYHVSTDTPQTEFRCRTTKFSRLAEIKIQSRSAYPKNWRIRTDNCSSFAIDDHSGHTVSRNHCEIYVIVYEHAINHVYVRDRKSVNGTYVNGKLIGSGPEISSGYLLQDGDVVEIRPYWRFTFTHHSKPMDSSLSEIQIQEAKVRPSNVQI